MKRPKIILSVTTCLLGIVAFAATRANHKTLRIGCTKASYGTHEVTCANIGSGPKCRIGTATVYTCNLITKTMIYTCN